MAGADGPAGREPAPAASGAVTPQGRRRVVRRAAWLLLGGAGLVLAAGAAAVAWLTGSERGRDVARRRVEALASGLFEGRGTLTIGAIDRLRPDAVVARDVALRDSTGRAVVHVARVAASVRIADLFAGVVRLPALRADSVSLDLRQEGDAPFDIAYILSGTDTTRAPRAPGPTRLGEDVRIDTLALADVAVVATYPWAPHPAFTGAARDSVIALRDSAYDLLPVDGGFLERRRVTADAVRGLDARVVAPGDTPRALRLAEGDLRLDAPPVDVRALRGTMYWDADSLWFADVAVALPRSTLLAGGRLSWADAGPVRYDVSLTTDSLGLADIAWTWPVLPPDGIARGAVRLRTLDDPETFAVTLDPLDVRADASRVGGRITLVVEPVELRLRDVALDFAPLDAPLLRRLTEDAWPAALDGALRGRWRSDDAGTATRLRFDSLSLGWQPRGRSVTTLDARLAGGVRLGVAPAAESLAIRALEADVAALRAALVAVAPALDTVLPAGLDGRLAVQGRIDEADPERARWRDVIVAWTDAAGHRSQVGTSGRVTIGGRIVPDVELGLDALSLDALRRADSSIALRGTLAGALRVQDALPVERSMMDAAPAPRIWWAVNGRLAHVAGTAGTDTAVLAIEAAQLRSGPSAEPTTWRVEARLRPRDVDLAAITPRPAPVTRLGGLFDLTIDLRDDTITAARGVAALSQPATSAHPSLGFDASATYRDGTLLVDSARFALLGSTLDAAGAIALDSTRDSDLRWSWRPDSLGAIAPHLPSFAAMLTPWDSALATSVRRVADDTLRGDVSVSGTVSGALPRLGTNVAFGGSGIRGGGVTIGTLFGSARLDALPADPRLVAAMTLDSLEGIGAVRIKSLTAVVDEADAARGRARLSVVGRDTSSLRLRGGYARRVDASDTALQLTLDTIDFRYGATRWNVDAPVRWRTDAAGTVLEPFALVSNRGGRLTARATLPADGPVAGRIDFAAFPVAELAAFALGTVHLPTIATGSATLGGTRDAPEAVIEARLDSVGTPTASLDDVRFDARYAARRLDVAATLRDSTGGRLSLSVRVPLDLAEEAEQRRLVDEPLTGALVADRLRLEGLPLRLDAARDVRGRIDGRVDAAGTFGSPRLAGTLRLAEASARVPALGLTPRDGEAVLVATGDTLSLAPFRVRSGASAGDTLTVRGTVAGVFSEAPTVDLVATLAGVAAARQRGGTTADVEGRVTLRGPIARPTLGAQLFVPTAGLVLDLASGTEALDLASPDVQPLLRAEERDVAGGRSALLALIGERLDVGEARLRLGDDVWVRTAEANVQLDGDVSVLEVTGRTISLDGEVRAIRGTYRLDLGVVTRGFTVDSGRVRFFPGTGVDPSLDLWATHVVRGVNGRDVPVTVAIGGTLARPSLTLGSADASYASAPESELISLLVFGAPTFALDGQSQQTVRAVTGLLLPSLTGAVEGTLQRLLPVFNTVQVNAAGGQSGEELGALSLLDNLSITAGKQVGRNTYLRLDTGVCRGVSTDAAARSLSLWYGVAAEYRLSRGLTAQVGVDPGPSPCNQALVGAAQRLQFGFDLFKEWVF